MQRMYSAGKAIIFAGVFISIYSNSCKYASVENDPKVEAIIKNLEFVDGAHKDEAIAQIDSAYYASVSPGDINTVNRFNLKCGHYFANKKQYDKALLYIDSLLDFCEPRLDIPLFALRKVTGLRTKGKIYYELENYDEAMHYFVLSRRAAKALMKNDCTYLTFSGIANLLFRQEKYLSAASEYLEGYRNEIRCRQDAWERTMYTQANLNSAALCYTRAGLLDSASYFYDSALHIIIDAETTFPQQSAYLKLARGVVYEGQAELAVKQKQFEKAETLFIASIERTKTDYTDYTYATKLSLADLYLNQDKNAKAKALIDELKTVVLTDDASKRDLYKLQSSSFKKNNNADSAYKYLEKFVAIKDTIAEKSKRLSRMDVGKEFENREQKAINQLLVSENKSKSFQLAVAVLLGLLAVVTILFVWFNLKKTARHVKELEALNQEVLRKNEDLQEAFFSLEQSHRENTRITRMVAHDLKNPISGIRNLITGLLKKEQSDESREALELIKNASTNSISFINDILSEKSTTLTESKGMINIKRLVEYCVDLLQTKADEKNQELLLYAEPVIIPGNRQKIWRVMSNILNNAIKFSYDNSTIVVKLEKKGKSVLVSVEDNGIGIPNNLKDKIFELAPEASRIGTAGEESYGLGLSISSKIIKEHNGSLWFESNKNQGCTFYVELPLAG
ncbi:MAG: ATP-binding protein [Agriterribacter sp.]